jgi:hypothetical protein
MGWGAGIKFHTHVTLYILSFALPSIKEVRAHLKAKRRDEG